MHAAGFPAGQVVFIQNSWLCGESMSASPEKLCTSRCNTCVFKVHSTSHLVFSEKHWLSLGEFILWSHVLGSRSYFLRLAKSNISDKTNFLNKSNQSAEKSNRNICKTRGRSFHQISKTQTLTICNISWNFPLVNCDKVKLWRLLFLVHSNQSSIIIH